MATKVAINGFGRIGRLVARAILERDDHDLDLVSINDLADTKSNAILFQYDSTHGRFPGTVEVGDNAIIVNGKAWTSSWNAPVSSSRTRRAALISMQVPSAC